MKRFRLRYLTYRGAASPQVLSFLIIAGGFIGVLVLWLLEPWLIPPAVDEYNVIEANRIKDPVSAEELQAYIDYLRSQSRAFDSETRETAGQLESGLGELEGQLQASSAGFSCPPIDYTRFVLQQYQPNFVYLRDWLRDNRRRIDRQDLQEVFARLTADLDATVRFIDAAISTYQSYQSAAFQKAAVNALRKLPPRFRSFRQSLERVVRQAEKLP